nr:asparaginase [Paenibacillus bovis]
MKRILVIHTGGTIAMEENHETGVVTPKDENPLPQISKQFETTAKLILKQPFLLPSPHITPKEMLLLKELIEEEYEKNNLDGVVITHGTDTLEETAYFLDLTVNLNIPIILTGAMRSSNEIGSDGLYNFITSIRVACSDSAKNKGVLVVLNDEIHTAMNVTKTHTTNVSTFQSPQYGPIGLVTKRDIIFQQKPDKSEKYAIKDINVRVALLKAYSGMEADVFHSLHQLKYDGVVIEAFGTGNLPPATIEGIKKLLDAHIPIVLVSRCFNGIAQDTYQYVGGGKQLKEMGVIFCNGLNGPKARIKVLVALSSQIKKPLNEVFT